MRGRAPAPSQAPLRAPPDRGAANPRRTARLEVRRAGAAQGRACARPPRTRTRGGWLGRRQAAWRRARSPAELARDLSHWAVTRGWCGTDPYDALNSSRRLTRPLTRTALGRRTPDPGGEALAARPAACPRHPTRRRRRHARARGLRATRAGASSTAAEHAATLRGALRRSGGAALGRLRGGLLGLPLPVQSRVFFYARGEPNTIATAFAGHGAAGRASRHRRRAAARDGAGGRRVLRPPRTPDGVRARAPTSATWPGDRSPIHNSNLLVARASRPSQRHGEDGAGFRRARPRRPSATRTTRQRPDGSWPYGERADLEWVDSFHTGYVLDALRACADAGVATAEAEAAWSAGSASTARKLFLPMGLPSTTAGASCPIDAQCVAQGIQTLAIAARHDPSYAESARATFDFARHRMLSAARPADLPAPPTVGKRAVAHALVGRPDAARARAPDRARGARAVRARSRRGRWL